MQALQQQSSVSDIVHPSDATASHKRKRKKKCDATVSGLIAKEAAPKIGTSAYINVNFELYPIIRVLVVMLFEL
jgi:hypothetical protein